MCVVFVVYLAYFLKLLGVPHFDVIVSRPRHENVALVIEYETHDVAAVPVHVRL
jgi:hypothetical protein